MKKLPWFDEEIPFTRAAEIGTQKVIYDHSTIGIVVTTDVSFTDIPAQNYIPATERTIEEYKADGSVKIDLTVSDVCYYELLSDLLGEDIRSEYRLFEELKNCVKWQKH